MKIKMQFIRKHTIFSTNIHNNYEQFIDQKQLFTP